LTVTRFWAIDALRLAAGRSATVRVVVVPSTVNRTVTFRRLSFLSAALPLALSLRVNCLVAPAATE
jgi:hypothetical protein